jgi:hypothetical protein
MSEKIECLVCGRDMTGSSQLALYYHAVSAHLEEVLNSPAVLQKLGELQRILFCTGEKLADRLKGTAK